MTKPCILTLDALGDAPVGGKAEGLAKLVRLGLRVPRAFVVVGATPGHLPEDLEARYAELGGNAVAVRSSALGEDSADASFAGQYETILDVTGTPALRAAIDACLASLKSSRANVYRDVVQEQSAGDDVPHAMSVVVQNMAPAASAGVLFTADPVTGRRDRIVIDAVEGLGEALVSGHASPDHYVLDRSGATREAELEGETPILSEAARQKLLASALSTEAAEGCPLDLEWAVDAQDEIHWLQARPITHLPPDPNELDTPLTDPTHIYTRCNVGEMFPGACTPLSYSFTARSIDVGMQMMHVQVGIQDTVSPNMRFLIMNSGHLFLNLSTMSETATHALGSSAEQLALSICGRPITEFTIRGSDPPPRLRRFANGVRYLGYLFSQPKARREMRRLIAELHFPESDTAAAAWQEIDRRFHFIYDAMHYHLISSASSGVLTPTLLGVMAGGNDASEADHAAVAALLAGADDIESADIIAGAERIQERIAPHPNADAAFTHAEPEAALEWIRSPEAGEARHEFERYLQRHGHRAIKELELRQPEWREDPIPLIRSLQVPLRQRVAGSTKPQRPDRAPTPKVGRATALLTRMARQAVRSREETKSGLVAVTTSFKEAYRGLAKHLVREGLLPDRDAVFFLTHEELGRLTRSAEAGLAATALARREAFAQQESYEFPDVFQGEPPRLCLDLEVADSEGIVRGAPVSRGRVVGMARIVRSLEEAEGLERGEILIAPITDVGWTPYFSLISGLVTDIGRAVSHGAVVAREYGLPAVVNTRIGTRVFKTGDRVVLDGELGIVRLANDDD
ncbi:MAG: pyruvate, water dikinase [Deltaproteobacteria bacterium]|nr:pyruvate, water dikinase [Deltaproteobacteria bacterium]